MSIKEKLTFKNIAISVSLVVAAGAAIYYFFNSDDTDSISELATAVIEAAAEATETVVETAVK